MTNLIFVQQLFKTLQLVLQDSTLPKGHIGYIEVPITNEQPKYYQVNDLNTLVHNVAHTYHPDITEPIPLSNYNTPTQDIPSLTNHFSIHQIYMISPTLHDTPHSSIYNVQPTSDTPKSRTFPTLPYSNDNFKFLNKFNFQFSNLTDTEYVTLCKLLGKHKSCYATHKNDVRKIATPFRIRLKPNAQLIRFIIEKNSIP